MSSGKKIWSAALLATAMLAVTAACGSGGSTDGKVKLRFAYWGSDARREMTEAAITKFEAKNPTIDVEGEISDFPSYYERLATQVAGRDAPDVMTLEIRALREYAERGTLADLASKVSAADIDAKILATGVVHGKQYAIPSGVNSFAMVVNPALVKRAKATLPDDSSWTWEDFVDLCSQVTAGTSGKITGTQLSWNPAYLQIYAAQKGEQLYTGNKIGVSPQTLKDWWAITQDLIKTKGSPTADKSSELYDAGIEQTLIGTNTGATSMIWTNVLGAAAKASGQELDLIRMPKIEGATTSGMFLQPAMFYTASARSEHAAEAAKFIDFMINDAEAGQIILSDRGLPANAKVLSAVSAKLPDADQKTLAFVNEVRGELAEPPAAPPKGSSAMEGILRRYSEEVIFNRMTPDEAAQKLITEANALLAG
ncbi:extracellular solute-binding protein [Nonomuraea deserti]|uniref:Extracellular solute-binding protein n=1 Tax=Nonomuraea deserti TaxID=1848322 RepID=A0A4R4U3K9_9ACTN|nr:extracellular solute-binding protein [Nonomuraea deserti]TDC85390.1 extracellular solute-binding protein [Nonomuraea deserti]